MTEKKTILVTLVAVILALAVSCSQRGPGSARKDFRAQYEKVTPGMDMEKLSSSMDGTGAVLQRGVNPNGEAVFLATRSDGSIQKATFLMKDGRVASKEIETLERPGSVE